MKGHRMEAIWRNLPTALSKGGGLRATPAFSKKTNRPIKSVFVGRLS